MRSGTGFDDLVVVEGPRGGRWFAPLPPAAVPGPGPAPAPAAVAIPAWQPARVRPPRARRHTLAWAAALATLGAPGLAAGATTCSAYMGQVVINELRIGKSNGSDAKNQIELYNIGDVAPAVWQTWSIQVWFKDGNKAAVKKGTYALNSGVSSNGAFIWNTAKYWLLNHDNKAADIQVLDASDALVAYFAIEGQAVSVPGCYGSVPIVQSSGKKDEKGGIMRPTDGDGAWPAGLTKTDVHTIGRTNECTSGGGDLVVSISPDTPKAILNTTTVATVVTVFNNSCSTNVSGTKIATTNTGAGYFGSLSTSTSKGSVSTSGSGHLWNIGTLNAGVAETLTISGKPNTLGVFAVGASVSAPANGLLNTGDDSDSSTITVQEYNYVGFDIDSGSVTEGTDTDYSATVNLDIVSNKSVTVNYSVSGTAGAGDTDLPASGSVVIAAGETSHTIDFAITDDALHEPTKNIVLTITGVSSADATVKIGTTPLGYYLTETITLLDDDPPGVDHYEISLPSSSVNCLPSTVTVTACSDASSPCTSPATAVGGATATLATDAGSLGATTITFDAGGAATTTLSHPSAADGAPARVTLSGPSIVAVNAAQCCPDGIGCAVRSYCDSTFNTSAFIIAAGAGGAGATIPVQTAGTASGPWTLRAVKSNTSTQACEAALTGTTTVNWAQSCNDPTTCQGNRLTLTGASTATVAGNPDSGVTTTTAVEMTFDADGNAPFSFTYGDVGRITLSAGKPAGGMLQSALGGSSNAFVVKPAGFVLSAIKCTNYAAGGCNTGLAGPGNNPAAASSAGAAFVPAGQPFSATVTAVGSTGAAVPNFGKETSPEGVTLAPTLVLPAGGTAGTLANPGTFGSFAGGAATGSSFSYSEAGIITLTPALASGNYLGSAGAVTGTASGNVGRFYADHLTTTVTPACSGSFTYAGQPFGATVTARNMAGGVLANYDTAGGFARAVTLTDGAALGLGALAGDGVPATAFAAGIASATPAYGYASKLGAPGTLVLRAVDSDGASSSGRSEGSTLLRSGRLRLSNAFGRETTALQLAVQAEYWTGNSWLLNGSDSCTTVPATAVGLSNQRSSQGAATGAWSTTPSAITLVSGSGLLSLSAPSPAGTGSVDISLNLGAGAADQSCVASPPATTGAQRPWLRSNFGACATSYDRDPSARASFGIFSPETRKTVHLREIF